MEDEEYLPFMMKTKNASEEYNSLRPTVWDQIVFRYICLLQ